LLHLHGIAGIADVAAGEAEMEPAAGVVIDGFRHGGGEPDDIMIEHLLQFLLACDEAGQVGEPFVTAGFDPGKILCRDNFFLHQGLAGEQLDLQPDLQLVFVSPNRPHFGTGIARNHGFIKKENGLIKKVEIAMNVKSAPLDAAVSFEKSLRSR